MQILKRAANEIIIDVDDDVSGDNDAEMVVTGQAESLYIAEQEDGNTGVQSELLVIVEDFKDPRSSKVSLIIIICIIFQMRSSRSNGGGGCMLFRWPLGAFQTEIRSFFPKGRWYRTYLSKEGWGKCDFYTVLWIRSRKDRQLFGSGSEIILQDLDLVQK